MLVSFFRIEFYTVDELTLVFGILVSVPDRRCPLDFQSVGPVILPMFICKSTLLAAAYSDVPRRR
jgi:hypothetical protein